MTLSVDGLDSTLWENALSSNDSSENLERSPSFSKKSITFLKPENNASVLEILKIWKEFAQSFEANTDSIKSSQMSDCTTVIDLVSENLRAHSDFTTFVCKDDDGNEQGFMQTSNELSSVLEIKTLVANPKYFKKGIGSLLLEVAEKIARNENRREIQLGAACTAIPFYRKRGYDINIPPGYYLDAQGRIVDRYGLIHDSFESIFIKRIG